LASLLCGAVLATSWDARIDEGNGLPFLSKGGVPALTSAFVFWGENWAFSDQRLAFNVRAPYVYTIKAENQSLNLALTGRVIKSSERSLIWDFDFEAGKASPRAIGGGIAFAFDLADFGSELGEPELIPGNLGWVWGRAGGARIEMRFDHPLAALHFEGGKKSELRAYFYSDGIPLGRTHYVATLAISGDASISPTRLEKFGLEDPATWPSDILGSDSSPVDLSFLNAAEKPAGKHGFLQAKGESLVFGDGTQLRFWGTNLTAYALFETSKADAKRQAHRLSELGFNLVRLHHHDSAWVNPNVFGDSAAPNTVNLSEETLEKLDWWIKCLKDEGIYVWLDMNVGRRLKAGDGVQDFDELRQGKDTAGVNGYNYVNDGIRQAMKHFDEQYLNHQNRFTGLRYKDDPAIVTVLVSNENDITHHFGNALLPDKGLPKQSAIYLREAERFADKYSLPKDRIWRAWEDGPSKIFLNDLEERFNADMISFLHTLGVKVPIVTTSTWGSNPLSSLPALTTGDVIDAHSYGGPGELDTNPMFGPTLVHWLAAAHVLGKPLTVTEWGVDDHGSLASDRQDIPLYIAGSAAMQGWSAVMFYAYSQESLSAGTGTPSIYHAYNDPALLSSFPAAALLFRQQHVAESTTRYVFAPDKALLFDRSISAATSIALRTASERGKLQMAMPRVPELPWLKESVIPPDAQVFTDPQKSLIPTNASEIVSDTHELIRNWDLGTFAINTPRTQSAMGWIGGKPIALADISMDVTTRNGVIAVQSLDGIPIRQSRDIMISIGARSVPAGSRSLPFYSEPMNGKLLITAPPALTLNGWDPRSGKMRRLSQPPYLDGHYVMNLDRSLPSGWLVLSAMSRSVKAIH
jgi:hypothetical protein